jgi:hypothetical protein
VVHSRKVYNLLDLIGALGGVLEIIVSVLGFFFLPISSHMFTLKALEKLFLARSHDNQVFVKVSHLKNDKKQKKFLSLKAPTPIQYKNTQVEAEA